MWDIIELDEHTYLIKPKDEKEFTCILNDDTEVKLGIIAEQINWRDHDPKYDKYQYFIGLQFSIFPIDPIHPDILKEALRCMGLDEEDVTDEAKIYAVYKYAGGVPCTGFIIYAIEKNIASLDREGYEVPSWEEADRAVRLAAKIAPALSGTIGFILDQRVNRIGNTGWDIIEFIVNNYDYISNTIRMP